MTFKHLLIGIVLVATTSFGQNEIKRNLYYGNQAYVNGDFEEALDYYQAAVNRSPLNYKANYNLANTYLRLNKQEKAIERYNTIVNLAPSSYDKASVYHNMGNAHLMNQDLEGAIEAYKDALRLNPSDEQTRYNLAYCIQQKEKQQQQQQNQDQQNQNQQNQDQQNGQDGNQQNQDQNQNGNQNQQQNDQQNGDKQDQQNQGGDQQDQQNQNNQQQSQGSQQGDSNGEKKKGEGQKYGSKLSKEQIENLLNAYYKREKELQKKLNKRKQIKNGSSEKKDW